MRIKRRYQSLSSKSIVLVTKLGWLDVLFIVTILDVHDIRYGSLGELFESQHSKGKRKEGGVVVCTKEPAVKLERGTNHTYVESSKGRTHGLEICQS